MLILKCFLFRCFALSSQIEMLVMPSCYSRINTCRAQYVHDGWRISLNIFLKSFYLSTGVGPVNFEQHAISSTHCSTVNGTVGLCPSTSEVGQCQAKPASWVGVLLLG
jgi:hypothetical protein